MISNVQKIAFVKLSHRTAGSLGVIFPGAIVVSVGGAMYIIIVDHQVKIGQITIVYQQIGGEIVQPVSTRGNCKHPCCVVTAESQLLTE